MCGPVHRPCFGRHSGVDLVDAVAASTASGAPYRIGDDRYLDGGYRRNENADLAAGYERVLVLSPPGGRVETILPDSASLAAFGGNLMDPSARPPAARAGHDQGSALAGRLTGFWR